MEPQQGPTISRQPPRRRVARFPARLLAGVRQAQVVDYAAACDDAPRGVRRGDIECVSVRLSLRHPSDLQVLRTQGKEGLRRARILRLAFQASVQQARLTQEDLAALVGVSVRTVKRDLQAMRQGGIEVPTRG